MYGNYVFVKSTKNFFFINWKLSESPDRRFLLIHVGDKINCRIVELSFVWAAGFSHLLRVEAAEVVTGVTIMDGCYWTGLSGFGESHLHTPLPFLLSHQFTKCSPITLVYLEFPIYIQLFLNFSSKNHIHFYSRFEMKFKYLI